MTNHDFKDGKVQATLRELLWKLNLCNCGRKILWKCLYAMLERSCIHSNNSISPTHLYSFYEPLVLESVVVPGVWVEFVAQLLDAMRLIEHGSGIGAAWLTPQGEILLSFLREFGTDDYAWPNWAQSEV